MGLIIIIIIIIINIINININYSSLYAIDLGRPIETPAGSAPG